MWSGNICLCKYLRAVFNFTLVNWVCGTPNYPSGFVRTKPQEGTTTAAQSIHASGFTCVRLVCSSSRVNSIFQASLSPALPLRWDPHPLPGQTEYIFSLASLWPTPGSSVWLDVPGTPQKLGRLPKCILMSSPPTTSSLGFLQCQRAPDPCILCG